MNQNEKDAVAAAMLIKAFCNMHPNVEEGVNPCVDCVFFNHRCGLKATLPCYWEVNDEDNN